MNKDVQGLIDWSWSMTMWIPENDRQAAQDYILGLSERLSTLGCWIPCSPDNPPPADTPMLVWVPAYLSGGVRYSAKPGWCAYGWEYMIPGEDFTHYMLIGEPTE